MNKALAKLFVTKSINMSIRFLFTSKKTLESINCKITPFIIDTKKSYKMYKTFMEKMIKHY